MRAALKRRRYRGVAVVGHGEGFAVALDGKLVHTPQRRVLALPTRALAEAVAAEWQAQGTEVDPRTMPLTRLAGTVLDLVAPQRAKVVAMTADYAGTDLLCYRAAAPPALVERQHSAWQPLLAWAAERYGAALEVEAGVIAVAQPPASLAALRQAVEAYDDRRLAALAAATAATGSLVLALALVEGRLEAETAWALSQLDERYQSERWGEDAEAVRRAAGLKADIAAVARFLELLAP